VRSTWIQWRDPSLCASMEPRVNDSAYFWSIDACAGLSACGTASDRAATTRPMSGA
jgi:hypothetical protein